MSSKMGSALTKIQGLDPAPKPFLRWAGGKRRVVDRLHANMPLDFSSGKTRVFEPFLGGGAFAFSLGNEFSNFFTPGSLLHLNDVNDDLICTYVEIRDNLEGLIGHLKKITKDKSQAEFEAIKKSRPKTNTGRAARFIYLNRTCFNGLWRVNSKGEFNVPWGKLKDPLIIDSSNLKLCSKRLKGSTITNHDFVFALAKCKKGDFVYLDPPYIPLNSSSSFSKYAKGDFSIQDHEKLSEVIADLSRRGVKVLLSNSDTKLTRQIYGDVVDFKAITVQRSISANSTSRVKVKEILGANYF